MTARDEGGGLTPTIPRPSDAPLLGQEGNSRFDFVNPVNPVYLFFLASWRFIRTVDRGSICLCRYPRSSAFICGSIIVFLGVLGVLGGSIIVSFSSAPLRLCG
jgi:hypothetical protein